MFSLPTLSFCISQSFHPHLPFLQLITSFTSLLPTLNPSFLSFFRRTMRRKRRCTVQRSTDTPMWFQCCFMSWLTPPWETASRKHLWTWRRCMDGCRSVRRTRTSRSSQIKHGKTEWITFHPGPLRARFKIQNPISIPILPFVHQIVGTLFHLCPLFPTFHHIRSNEWE